MDKYEMFALFVLSLFLIPLGYVAFVIVSIFRSPKLPATPPVDGESWIHGNQQLEIIYRKGARPEQKIIDEIKNDINRYEEMIAAYIKATEENLTKFNAGLIMTDISFPIYDSEQGEYDFSINYSFENNSDMMLEACIKDGKVQSVSVGD